MIKLCTCTMFSNSAQYAALFMLRTNSVCFCGAGFYLFLEGAGLEGDLVGFSSVWCGFLFYQCLNGQFKMF